MSGFFMQLFSDWLVKANEKSKENDRAGDKGEGKGHFA